MDHSRPAISAMLKTGRYGLLLVPVLFLAVFFLYPLLSILVLSFSPSTEGAGIAAFRTVIESPYYRGVIGFTLFQALLSTALTLLLAIPAGYVFSHFTFPAKSLLLSLSTLPFVLPTVVVSAAFTSLVGRNGVANSLLVQLFGLDGPPIRLERTFLLILIAHVFYNYPLALRMISSYWTRQDPRIEEAARVLGSHGWKLWWHIRLPLLRPIILAAGILVFAFTFTSFGVILILGGPQFATIEVEIYRQAVNYFKLDIAGVFSIIQMLTMIVLMTSYTVIQSTNIQIDKTVILTKRPSTPRQRLGVGLIITFTLILLFSPLMALVIQSFSFGDTGFTTRYYGLLTENTRGSILYVAPISAIWNSLVYASGTTVLALLLGILSSQLITSRAILARWMDPIFMLPLATSAVTLGFGFIIALDEPPLNLRTSPLLVLFSHILIALPFVVRNVVPELRSIPTQMREAAQVLGASPWRIWTRIDFPMIRRGLAVGATFAFTISMGEFGASLFIVRPDTPTLPIAIYRLLSQPGASNYGQALALSVILMVICALGFILLDRVNGFGSGEL